MNGESVNKYHKIPHTTERINKLLITVLACLAMARHVRIALPAVVSSMFG